MHLAITCNEDPLGLMTSIELTCWCLQTFFLQIITYWQSRSHAGLLKNTDNEVAHLICLHWSVLFVISPKEVSLSAAQASFLLGGLYLTYGFCHREVGSGRVRLLRNTMWERRNEKQKLVSYAIQKTWYHLCLNLLKQNALFSLQPWTENNFFFCHHMFN